MNESCTKWKRGKNAVSTPVNRVGITNPDQQYDEIEIIDALKLFNSNLTSTHQNKILD
jgi:hypothetical protein